MACFVVAYDLNTIGQNYDCIIDKLKQLGHCRTQQSVWFVEYEGSEENLAIYLAACLDTNDRLFVSEVSGSWAGKGMQVCGKWLNDRGY